METVDATCEICNKPIRIAGLIRRRCTAHQSTPAPGQEVLEEALAIVNASNLGPDFDLLDGGSVVILYPKTATGKAWVEAHIGDDAATWAGGIVIERRYTDDVLAGIEADGLTWRIGGGPAHD